MAKPSDSDSARNLDLNGVIFSHGDIRAVVERFYALVEVDPLLGAPFSSVTDWPHHIERLTHFWWVRFGGEPYIDTMYDPVGKHYAAGFNRVFLTRWLELFDETVAKTLKPDQAEIWSKVAHRMGEALTMKNEFYKAHVAKG